MSKGAAAQTGWFKKREPLPTLPSGAGKDPGQHVNTVTNGWAGNGRSKSSFLDFVVSWASVMPGKRQGRNPQQGSWVAVTYLAYHLYFPSFQLALLILERITFLKCPRVVKIPIICLESQELFTLNNSGTHKLV